MDAQQFNQLMGAIQTLTDHVYAIERKVDNINTELTILRATSATTAPPPPPASPYMHPGSAMHPPPVPMQFGPHPPPQFAASRHPSFSGYQALQQAPPPANPSPNQIVTNAQMLPFTLEAIAYETWAGKNQDTRQTCGSCGEPRGQPGCFKKRHFDWCRTHALEVLPGSEHCRAGAGCWVVGWEKVEDWEELVAHSKLSEGLGGRGVPDLDSVLFE